MMRIRRVRADGDEGVALVVAIATIGLVTVMMGTMMVFVLRENRQTGNNRQRAVSVTTAEGAVDAAFAEIQDKAVATLPCTSTVTTGDNPPDVQTITTTVRYYDATNAELSCPLPAAALAVTALVSATSVSSANAAGGIVASRTVESAVRLKATFANGFGHAIFAASGVTMAGNLTLLGEASDPNADIYTNGNFSCPNGTNQVYEGSVYAQGSIDVTGNCAISVNAHAKTGFSADGNGSVVNGDVRVSQGNAAVATNANIGGTVSALTTSGGFCTSQPTKCTTGASAAPDPPSAEFPQFLWPAAKPAWLAAPAESGGPYTELTLPSEYTGCALPGGGVKDNGPGRWLRDKAREITTPTIVYTSCQVILAESNPDVKLGSNLLFVAAGGFSFKSTTIGSTSATTRYLYMVQPYDAVSTHPCATTTVSMNSTTEFLPTVKELIYSPCSIDKSNRGVSYGQIYSGGTATLSNNSTMTYSPLPVFGVTAASTKVKSYALDVLYKRETTS